MKLRQFFISLVYLALFPVFESQALFVEGLEDVPLPEGVVQLKNDGVHFGNEESRFIEVYLQSKQQSFDSISRFYQTTLPQMGWQKKSTSNKTLSFERDGEILELDNESTKSTLIRMTVKSKN
jgi:hypothetical protein